MSNPSIQINTKYGLDQYNILASQKAEYTKKGLLEEFRKRCEDDYKIQVKYLEYFLDDDDLSNEYKMNEDDIKGFQIFNEQSDVCTCLKYFSGGVM